MRPPPLRICITGVICCAAALGFAQFPKIIANVELVNMVFTVQDGHNGFVTGLTANNVKITEDGRAQTIRYFSAEHDVPLTLGLLIDTSGSQRRVLTDEQTDSRMFFQKVISPADQAFVVSFDDRVYLLQDLTNSPLKLGSALDRARIGRSTALWDAVFLACRSRMAKQTGRKALVVVTDGGATPSEYSLADAIRLSLDTDTVVFGIFVSDASAYGGGGGGLGTGVPSLGGADPTAAGGADPNAAAAAGAINFGGGGGGGGGMRVAGPDQLEKLAKETGGRTYNVSGNKLVAAFAEIENELRNQYTLAYKSDHPQHDGKFRRVQLRLVNVKGATIRTRIGYTMPAY